ncbi:unnamed protein product, partial [Rhizoctonia solani]
GSNTRTAYFGVRLSESEINDYLTPSADSLMISSLHESSLLTPVSPQYQFDRGTGPRFSPADTITPQLPDSVPRGVRANKQAWERCIFFILEEFQRHRIIRFFAIGPLRSTRGFLMMHHKAGRDRDSILFPMSYS